MTKGPDSEDQNETLLATILVVDDDAAFRDYLWGLLEENGYRAYVASDGPEGWDGYHFCEPDLMITGIFMSGMSGTELIAAIKRQDEDFPIIAITTGDSHDFGQQGATLYGADAVLCRPFSLQALLYQVRRLLQTGVPGDPHKTDG